MAGPTVLTDVLSGVRALYKEVTRNITLPPGPTDDGRAGHLAVDILLPAVTGSLTTDREYPGEGRIVLLGYRGKGPVLGAFHFTAHDAPQSIHFEFDQSLASTMRVFGQALNPQDPAFRFGGSSQELARLLQGAVERLERVEELCAASVGARTPDDRLAYAEALWARARLLLIRDDTEEAARCAVEGAEHAERAAWTPGCPLEAAGQSLAHVLDVLHQPETAEEVRKSLRGA